MSEPIITVEHLSKRYVLGHQLKRDDGLRHALEHLLQAPAKWMHERKERRQAAREEFWALNDVSFEIQPGEVVGIIGRNGAGKSTLLKILSRITEPTAGRVTIDGRVASLLEVGTGFHNELTGRENIFLNGAILGMSRGEIKRKFEEIVAFSEVEKFLDTPVKRYSSGMYVRLAFAVAAHLEPEVLIVDEVLAVGDAAFQQKCIGKMKDVSQGGRTVLFVSHNMQAVVTLCQRAVWLQGGRVCATGPARSLVEEYIQKNAVSGPDPNVPLIDRPRAGTGAAKFTKLTVVPLDDAGQECDHIVTGTGVRIDLEIRAEGQLREANVAVTLYDTNNYRLIDVNTALKGEFLSLAPGERATVSFVIDELLLKPGRYVVELWLGRGGIEDTDFIREAGVIEVHDNVNQANHTETFPGIYQCRFSHRIAR
ncbi:MAG: ABC transporter ATP-binding protein [Verrucomicrobiota bacterium]